MNVALNLLLLNRRNSLYLLRDEFTDDLSAGGINGTLATDGINTRTVVDTESKISQSSGKSSFASGKAAPGNGDPGYWLPGRTRTVGQVLVIEINLSTLSGKTLGLGWDTDQALGINGYAIVPNGTSNLRINDGSDQITIGAALSTATSYKFVLALNSTGAQAFGYGGIYAQPRLLWPCINLTTTPLYPAISNNSASFTADFVRIPSYGWLASPLLSDGFGGTFGTLDGLGHMDAATAVGSGGGGGSWTQVGTWATSAGIANASALSGGLAFAYKDAGTKDVFLSVAATRSAGNVGLLARYADANNYLIAYIDGTNAKLDQVVGGSTTNLISGAATPVAGKLPRLELDGNNGQLFYNQVRINSTSSINAGLTGTRHGVYTTDTGNTFDNFVCFATGIGNEYGLLTDFFQ